MISEEFGYICMDFVMVSWVLNILVCVLSYAIKVYKRIKDCIRKRKENIAFAKTTPENFIKVEGNDKTKMDNLFAVNDVLDLKSYSVINSEFVNKLE